MFRGGRVRHGATLGSAGHRRQSGRAGFARMFLDWKFFPARAHSPHMKLLPLLLSLIAAPALFAQQPAATPAAGQATPSPNTAIAMWRATLPGGTYSVALRSIVSVSTHEYVVDGAARVTEVNIDTTGAALVRFYFIEPNTVAAPAGFGAATVEKAQQLLQEGAQRAGQDDVWKKVVKSYPTTTHTRTIEYRFGNKETLAKLFESAESAFRLNKNTVFKGE